ncbi:hypothetical protein L1987_50530 [Smallanthus sonchifolius]|uniref:Uncharacterized protein n=1 Tax=Smallanthus sonchifolius TaxID=185202 RepID=A0ACB9EMW1_9ASTR|nr:hypothetical protein L1987_50530 [Smallanthus sonchifolius]
MKGINPNEQNTKRESETRQRDPHPSGCGRSPAAAQAMPKPHPGSKCQSRNHRSNFVYQSPPPQPRPPPAAAQHRVPPDNPAWAEAQPRLHTTLVPQKVRSGQFYFCPLRELKGNPYKL